MLPHRWLVGYCLLAAGVSEERRGFHIQGRRGCGGRGPRGTDRRARASRRRAQCRDAGARARVSFGGILIVGSPEQRRAGIRDSADLALRDWLSFGEHGAEDTWPRRWAEAYVSGCREQVYDWLRGHGVRFFPVVHWVERGLYGGGNTLPRFHIVWGTGERLVRTLLDRLESHPHRDRLLLLHRHRVTDLESVNKALVGCSGVVETHDTDTEHGNSAPHVGEFAAEGDCLIIAAGGICGNLDLVRKHWHADWNEPPQLLLNGSCPAADGQLHGAAARLGANITHLDKMWHYAAGVHHWRPEHEHHGVSLVPPMSALWLNWRGERLGPPAMMAEYDTRYLVQSVCKQERQYSWQVFNWRIAKKELAVSGAEFNHAMRERRLLRFLLTTLRGDTALVRELVDHCVDFVTADSLTELAEKMNGLAGSDDVDAQTLAGEVGRYDDAIGRGKLHNDDQLRRLDQIRRYRGDRARTCRPRPIDDPRARPLIAVREFIITRKSLGGLQTDLQCRVLDHAGEPLPGLYAVGEAAGFGGGGIHGLRSLEGTFLGGCVFTGRAAARAIATG